MSRDNPPFREGPHEATVSVAQSSEPDAEASRDLDPDQMDGRAAELPGEVEREVWAQEAVVSDLV
jgi:hypothetical protein